MTGRKFELMALAVVLIGMGLLGFTVTTHLADAGAPKPPRPCCVWPIQPSGQLTILPDSTAGLVVERTDTVLFEDRHGDSLVVWVNGVVARVWTKWTDLDVIRRWDETPDSTVLGDQVGIMGVWNGVQLGQPGWMRLGVVYRPVHGA